MKLLAFDKGVQEAEEIHDFMISCYNNTLTLIPSFIDNSVFIQCVTVTYKWLASVYSDVEAYELEIEQYKKAALIDKNKDDIYHSLISMVQEQLEESIKLRNEENNG